jgi:chemotaxis protein CheD
MDMHVISTLAPLHSLHPGEWYFGSDYERLHTLLGSCVALSAWHPLHKVCGMCHYLLPVAPVRNKAKAGDCRYANNALAQMKKSMLSCAPLHEYRIGIYGGGDMFSFESPRSIGYENIAYARQWLTREKIQPFEADVGGTVSRSLVLLMATGEIQIKHYQMKV